MNKYVYTAKKDTAETVTGQISARSQDEAIEIISDLGLLPVSVKPEVDPKEKKSKRSALINYETFKNG